ncbi:cholesterol catabolism transcriptional regulator KstR [Actinomadura kijaniata]|uniref:AcrR family transcriptional regulator n=1 Tax=Actinomadura namibiensis TaxID=182080 RepID=A0A7W3LJ53_ACTNM|nr:TetR family transcriptional regulator [Actinomadura namibiensis]MBA8949101.1 AcrR family transcriptional regulator [Actinomadura namibiensis]
MSAEPTVTRDQPSSAENAAPQGARSRSQHQRRKRILQVAAALVSRGGIEEMQMRKVAERADVALGTLYRYFPSKEDLIVAVVSEELDLLEGSIERRPPSADTPPRRAVAVLMRATRGLMREPELASALIRSLLLSDVKTEFGDRMTGLLLRAAVGPDADVPDGDPRRVVAKALSSVWTMEMIEMLRGHATADQAQARLETVAARLLHDF